MTHKKQDKLEFRQLTSDDREAFARLGHYAFSPTSNSYENIVPEDYEETKPHLRDINQVYGYFEGKNLISTGAYFSSTAIIRNKELSMSGVYEVATTPTHRNRGFIRRILQRLLKQMKDERILISILYPFKFSFYEKFGWKLCNENHRYHIETDRFISRPVAERTIREVFTLDDIKKVYSKIAGKKYNYMLKRTENDWRRRVNPKKSGYMFVCYDDNDEACGYVIEHFLDYKPSVLGGVDSSNQTIYLPEIFWNDRKTKQALFNFLKTHIDQRKYIAFSTADPNMLSFIKDERIKANEVLPGSMARVVDIRPVIGAFDYPIDAEFIIKVNDQFCKWNDYSFNFSSKKGKGLLEETTQSWDVKIDIGALTQMIVGFRTSSDLYDSWEIECSKKILPLLDKLFPLQNNFFRDFF